MKEVSKAFKAHKIDHLQIQGSASAKSKNLTSFQDGEHRVLLLTAMDESASGANLTGANHAIFLSPLLADSQEIYDACETQAMGRLVRYGQKKHVYIWRFLSKDTIDEEIFKQRGKVMLELAKAAAMDVEVSDVQ
jgi:SNF2 family DNA or RNA helicase